LSNTHYRSAFFIFFFPSSAARSDLHSFPTRRSSDLFPRFGEERRMAPLVGDLPDPRHPPSACRFRTRCPVGPLYNPERSICGERSEEHTSELQSRRDLVCRLLLEKKK